MTTLGPPPLPIINDVVAIVSFLADSLDDLVEDAAKLAMLWFVGWIVWRVLSGARFGRRATQAAVVCAVAASHPQSNDISDAMGDRMAVVQDLLRSEPKADGSRSTRRTHLPGGHWSVVDDIVEDSFKLTCVGAHSYVGSLIGSGVTHAAPASTLARAAGLLVAVGTPAAQYRACDAYADELGDVVQRWLEARAYVTWFTPSLRGYFAARSSRYPTPSCRP